MKVIYVILIFTTLFLSVFLPILFLVILPNSKQSTTHLSKISSPTYSNTTPPTTSSHSNATPPTTSSPPSIPQPKSSTNTLSYQMSSGSMSDFYINLNLDSGTYRVLVDSGSNPLVINASTYAGTNNPTISSNPTPVTLPYLGMTAHILTWYQDKFKNIDINVPVASAVSSGSLPNIMGLAKYDVQEEGSVKIKNYIDAFDGSIQNFTLDFGDERTFTINDTSSQDNILVTMELNSTFSKNFNTAFYCVLMSVNNGSQQIPVIFDSGMGYNINNGFNIEGNIELFYNGIRLFDVNQNNTQTMPASAPLPPYYANTPFIIISNASMQNPLSGQTNGYKLWFSKDSLALEQKQQSNNAYSSSYLETIKKSSMENAISKYSKR